MGDNTDSLDFKREQRLMAMEEKRKKLAEARAKNSTLPRASTATPPSTPVKQLEGVGSSWTDIVSAIESLPTTPAKANEVGASSSNSDEAQPVKRAHKPIVRQLVLLSSHCDIAPKRDVQIYSRATQTTRTASTEQNMEQGTIESEQQNLATRKSQIEEPEPVIEETIDNDEYSKNFKDNSPSSSSQREENNASLMGQSEAASVVSSKDFMMFISQTSSIMDKALHLSERYDVLGGLYEAMDAAPKLTHKVGNKQAERIFTLFDKDYSLDQQFYDIDWNPFEKGKIITASYDNNGGSGSAILEFDLNYDGMLCNRLIHPLSRITAAKYWTFNDNTYNTSTGGGRLIIGGSYTGQIVLWDVRAHSSRAPIITVSNTHAASSSSGSTSTSAPFGVSPHKHPIYALQIVDGRHFASVDTLGTLAVWDIYKMESPLEEFSLTWVKTGFSSDSSTTVATGAAPGGTNLPIPAATSSTPSTSNEVSVTGISFKDENVFYVASEDGSLYAGQRHGDRSGLLQHFKGHGATLSSVRSHPTSTALPAQLLGQSSNSLLKHNFGELILTSSLDWSVNLWNPKLSQKPLATFSDFSDYVMDVAWSNHHPSLFAAVDSAGILSVWDICSEEKDVALITNSSAAPQALNKVSWSPHQPDLLVAASHSSHVHVFNIDTSIATPSNDQWIKFDRTVSELHQQLTQAERQDFSTDS